MKHLDSVRCEQLPPNRLDLTTRTSSGPQTQEGKFSTPFIEMAEREEHTEGETLDVIKCSRFLIFGIIGGY